ncbi:MAG: TIGR04086 family membrane protein [Blautia sp.]|nr:TIGR04086 family membrane protein [Blautia sp.]
MKIRTVLVSLLFAYGVTGAALLLLAFLMYKIQLDEGPVTAALIAVYVLSSFTGGLFAGKMIRKDKYLWGVVTGLLYFLLLLCVSFAVRGHWDMSIMHLVTIFFMCLGGGALGGMLA